MQEAIKIAYNSQNNVPVGVLVVYNDEILFSTSNKASKHAECIAMENIDLFEKDIYITLEPCPMCAYLLCKSLVKNIYFGASNKDYGAFGGAFNILYSTNLYKPKVFSGILSEECSLILKNFFINLR